MTVQEALDAAANATVSSDVVNDVFTINAETRVITIPDSEALFGVVSDEKSERKYFKAPRIVGNDVDLTKLNVYINYENAGGSTNSYLVQDVTLYGDSDEYVGFSWELSRDVTAYAGTVIFSVCAKKADNSGNLTTEWNTTTATGNVISGLEAEQITQEDQNDLLEAVLAKIAEITPAYVDVTMTAEDTSVILEVGKYYIFPEMTTLTITGTDGQFRFTSGDTATVLTFTDSIVSDLVVLANRTYEINIKNGYLCYTSWVVS